MYPTSLRLEITPISVDHLCCILPWPHESFIKVSLLWVGGCGWRWLRRHVWWWDQKPNLHISKFQKCSNYHL